jgi:hypothetical protein
MSANSTRRLLGGVSDAAAADATAIRANGAGAAAAPPGGRASDNRHRLLAPSPILILHSAHAPPTRDSSSYAAAHPSACHL